MKPLVKGTVSTGIGMLVLSSLVAGCGTASGNSSPSNSNGANSTSSGTPAATAKSLFPNGITLVVGYGPGGGNDIAARTIQPYLQKQLGVPVAVQNMSGGGGTVAAAYVYKQKPTSGKMMVWFLQTAVLEQNLKGGNFNTSKFTPVYGMYGNSENVLISAKSSKYKTLKDLENSKQTITVGVSGVANAAWLGVAYLAQVNHVNLKVVPFSSGGQAATAALGGSVDVTMTSMPSAAKAIKDGKAQGILQMGSKPNATVPGVPDIVSAGGNKSETFDNNIGIFGPPGMTSQAVSVLDKAFAAAEKNPQFISKAKSEGIFPVGQDSQQFGSLVQSFTSQISPQVSKLKSFMNQSGASG